MADYVVLPVMESISITSLTESGYPIYNNGSHWFRAATNSQNGSNNRAFLYSSNNRYYNLWVTNLIIDGEITVYGINQLSTSLTPERINNTRSSTSTVYHGYINIAISSDDAIASGLTLFRANDISFDDVITRIWASTPVVNPGVHVTFSPVYIPTYPGVHVQFNPVNLNPYEPGGESEPGGGGGDYDNPTDIINLPDLPTVKVSPFVKLWNPAEPEMQQLSDYIFSDNVWDAVSRQLFGNPIQYIISMGIVPVPLSIGGVKVPFHLGEKIGNFNMYEVGQQYMRYSCGSITIPQYWKSFMDYEPHTKIQIFLPFIGFRDLMASEVIGKEITVTYHIDVFSGACVAFVQPNGSVLYQYNGNVLTTIPYSANEFGNIITGAIGAVGGVATGILGISGAFAPAIGGMMAISGFTNAFSSVVGMGKESVIHGGNASSTSGLLSTRTPYVILNRPKQAIAERQNEYHGYATWYRANDFLFAKGFTKLAQIHLEGIPATDWEIQEIERLLKEGVIF